MDDRPPFAVSHQPTCGTADMRLGKPIGRQSSGRTKSIEFSDDNAFLLIETAKQNRSERPANIRFLSGWRVGAIFSLAGATFVLAFNIAITIWAWQRPGGTSEAATDPGFTDARYWDAEDNNVILYRGKCDDVRQLNIWVHILVNVVSTSLLCASNYCMQVLAAPNRAELDRAHTQRRQWLHIGVPNIRNLRHISRGRRAVWYLLGLSSAPLHLLLNSVIFSNLQASAYDVIPTTQKWLHGETYDHSSFLGFSDIEKLRIKETMDSFHFNVTESLGPKAGKLRYINTSTEACFNIYNNQYVSDVSNVFLIQDSSTVWRNANTWYLLRNSSNGHFLWTMNGTAGDYSTPYNRYTVEETEDMFPFSSVPFRTMSSTRWMCPSHSRSSCNTNNEYEVPKDKTKWSPYDREVKYCMIEQLEPKHCNLRFSLPIAVTVILANIVKVICMAVTLFMFRKHVALVTIGDAVSSYLVQPDQNTIGRCLFSKRDVETEWSTRYLKDGHERLERVNPRKYIPKAQRWAMAASLERWYWTYAFYLIAIFLCIPGACLSFKDMSLSQIWSAGIGKVTSQNLFSARIIPIAGILLANTPQALLSYLYLAYNALYTNMFVAHEWSTYMNERKSLRVTSPIGKQRATYWLNVPFRFAIPMAVMSGLMHWLASQSLFMVQITVVGRHGRPVSQISTCGYSPLATVLTLFVATLIAGSGLVASRCRFPAGIPLASSCSAAISAACHSLPEDVDAHVSLLQWGAVTHGIQEGENQPVGHCCFSSFPVERPMTGRLYA